MLWNSNTKQIYNSLERPVDSAKQAVLSQRQQNAVSQRTIYNFHSSSVICENKEIKGRSLLKLNWCNFEIWQMQICFNYDRYLVSWSFCC